MYVCHYTQNRIQTSYILMLVVGTMQCIIAPKALCVLSPSYTNCRVTSTLTYYVRTLTCVIMHLQQYAGHGGSHSNYAPCASLFSTSNP